jgi:hypothetical protein
MADMRAPYSDANESAKTENTRDVAYNGIRSAKSSSRPGSMR